MSGAVSDEAAAVAAAAYDGILAQDVNNDYPTLTTRSVPTRTTHTLDLTSTFRACANALTLDEPFVRDKAVFSLHDAMAASQLMDRKMDSCDIAPSLASPLVAVKKVKVGSNEGDEDEAVLFPRPIPTGLSDDFTVLFWESITMEQAAVIVTEILIRLTAQLNGASVGESTFTCLYAHRAVLLDMQQRLMGRNNIGGNDDDGNADAAEDFNHAFQVLLTLKDEQGGKAMETLAAQYVVLAASYALVEATEIFRGIVHNADVYEEEDFASNTFGIPFADVSENPSRGYISTALQLLSKAPPSSHREVVHHGLAFISPFLYVCTTMGKLTRQKMIRVVQDLQQKVNRALNHLQQLEKALNGDWVNSETYKYVTAKAFDSYVNRPLVGNAPVRKISFLTPTAALGLLRTITQELDWAVCRLLLDGNTLGRVIRILDRVSESSTNILSRSLIVLNLYFDERLLGQYTMQTVVTQHMKQWEHLPDNLIENEQATLLINRLAKPVYDTLKLRASNRNRQRIYMEAVMFQDWTSLQSEANLVDSQFRQQYDLDNSTPAYFGYYVVTSLTRLMDMHLQSAIEMGLFCDHEQLCSAFWYRDFLLALLEQNLATMKQGKEKCQLQTAVASTQNKAETKGKKKKNSKAKHVVKIKKAPEEVEDDIELRVIDLKRKVYRGLVRFIVCLRNGGYVTMPEFEFTSPRKMFEKRFEAFMSVRHPPFLSYDDFLAGADSTGISDAEMLQSTAELFQASKVAAESILRDLANVDPYYAPIQEEQVRALLKVSVGNAVYLMKLQQYFDKKMDLKVAYDFDVHKEFCIIKVS